MSSRETMFFPPWTTGDAAPPPLARALPAEALDVPWDRVHDEAEVLKHVLSEELEALIAAKLGHPTRDPHGDPIPSADLVIDEAPTASLAGLESGADGVFVRISDADPDMLRYLAGAMRVQV